MKLRSLLVIGLGIGVGYTLAKNQTRDDPSIVKGPREDQPSVNPAVRAITAKAQQFADQATVKSLEAIRGTRRLIRARLAEDADSTWN
jgi:hypothetical protein